jgi:hypothetical protein
VPGSRKSRAAARADEELPEVVDDMQTVLRHWDSIGIARSNTNLYSGLAKRDLVEHHLGCFFNDDDAKKADTFVVHYAGHGNDKNGGELVFASNTAMSFEEVRTILDFASPKCASTAPLFRGRSCAIFGKALLRSSAAACSC